MERWDLRDIELPDGSRSPAVLHSEEGAARVVLIELRPGQALGDHQVKENAYVAVVDGRIRVRAGDVDASAEPGTLFRFDPDERHSVSSEGGARILLMLAPWPGAGHFRGDERSAAAGA